MASLSDAQPPTSNGINGHPSPIATPPETASDLTPDRKVNSLGAKVPSPELPESNHIQNHEAFTSNQSQPVLPELAPPAEESTAPVIEMASEATPLPAAEKMENATIDAPIVPAPAEKEEAQPPLEPIIQPAADPSPPAAPAVDTLPEPVPVEVKVDVEMSEAAPHDVAAVAEPDHAESTQDTGISDAAATSATGDLSFHPASMSNLALDGSQEQPSAPATADTSMTDAPSQIIAKVAREREDDEDLEEPSAKRARTEDREAPAEPAEAQSLQANPDEMAVDLPAEQPAAPLAVTLPPRELPAGVTAVPNTLSDSTQEQKPLTPFANREIRKVLASVKKTKAGGFFKDAVKVKWPELWEQYIAKIETPVDISSMERKLRENKYTSVGELLGEVYLIRENAIKFNGPEHTVTGHAKSLVDNILTRFVEIPLEEPPKAEKKETKQIATRHTEPRAAAVQARRESRGAVASPTDEIVDSPVYAVPASGVPIIRRDSTINEGERPKRPIKKPKDKDLGFEPKNLKKKKQSPDFKFCEEVLRELLKQKHWPSNQWFRQPVDPVRDGIPNYFQIIKKPMDLSTMQEKLSVGEYNSAKDFESDFQLIIKNCKKFNTPDSIVTKAAEQLEQLFKQKWAEKDDWIRDHAPAPPSVAASSPAARDSDDEADASEPEAEEEAAVETSATLASLNKRIDEEQGRLNALLNAKIPDTTMIATQQSLLQMFQKSLIDEKLKLAETAKKAKKPAKPKVSKPKKAAGGAAAGGKKAGGAAAGGGSKKASGGKKSTKPARVMGQTEKNVVADGINNLEGHQLEKAIDIIKKDTNQEESASGELELDIDQLSQDALGKLYDLVVKAQPETKKKVEKARAASPSEPAGSQSKTSKPKKHKPMGKAEQERSIEKLREIKAQFQRPGSGSQEPLPSVEGNQPKDDESDDESEIDSEED